MKQIGSHDFDSVYQSLDINLDKLGCIMLDVEPLEDMKSSPSDLDVGLYYARNLDHFWIDGWVVGDGAHVTLLYGLLIQNAQNKKQLVDTVLEGWEPKEVTIDNVGFFESGYEDEPYWCVIAHVKVDDNLLEGHQRLELLPHINTFVGYRPHVTICYLHKALGEEFRDKAIEGFNENWAGKALKVKGLNYGK